MNRSLQRISLVLIAAAMACSHKAPAVTTPTPTPGPNADSIAAANAAAARAAQARADSIARAQQAARDAAARAEADRLARAAAAAAEAARSSLTAKIYFDYQKDDLLADAKVTLDAKVPVMRAHPELRIRIEGNADDRGSDEYNLALGQRRSAAARRYLTERGIPEARIDVVSFGEERPVCRDEGESCWKQNRRAEFSIVAGAESLNARQ
jgi:peptidoglycan-associated lipoprotein